MRALLLLALPVVLLAGGCGGGEPAGGDAPPQPGGYGGAGEARSIEEARQTGGRQLVRGTLVAGGGEVRLCGAILESFPPQCGQPSLLVEGLDVGSVAGTTTAEGVTWSEREIVIRGDVEGDVLRVEE